MTSALDDAIAQVKGMDDEARKNLTKIFTKKKLKWRPNPGPQQDAYDSLADILLFGGQAAGGKSDLGLGLAFTAHKRSLVMRRRYTDLSALTDRAIRINGTRDGFSGSSPPKLKTDDDRLIDFGACNMPGDEEQWQGHPHSLLYCDELAQFQEYQIRFLMGWVRTSEPDERCRVVFGSNPPLSAEGDWMIGMFRPWLDLTHPNPAKPGELRWFITDKNGKDEEVENGYPIERDGQIYRPKSRTFIPSTLSDNPYLANTDYKATMDALPEPLRSAVRDGNFMAARQDDALQVIPTEWIRAAQRRWTPKPPDGVPMCAIGVDVAQGGTDNTVLACRYDSWFAPLIIVPGKKTPTGAEVAGLIMSHRRGGAVCVVDCGGGYGGAAVEHLKVNDIETIAYKGSHGSNARTVDKTLKFYNKRAESWWKLREALDPGQEGGSPIALPDDSALLADLTTPRLKKMEIGSQGIQIESKEDIIRRLGHSPDKGDAVVMAWSNGGKVSTHFEQWKQKFKPKAILGHEAQRRRNY